MYHSNRFEMLIRGDPRKNNLNAYVIVYTGYNKKMKLMKKTTYLLRPSYALLESPAYL